MATPTLGFDDFYSTTLSAAITSTDTTIPVNSVPTASEGYLVIEGDNATNREIIYYTSKTASAVVCPSAAAGRGQGGTNAAAHAINVAVEMNTVAEMWEALQDGTAMAAGSIKPSNLAAGLGTSWAWQTWTPQLSNISGASVALAKYTQIGKTVNYEFELVCAGANIGSSPYMSLPVASVSYNAGHPLGQLIMDDSGTRYHGVMWSVTTNALQFITYSVSASNVQSSGLAATTPFTFGSGDKLMAHGSYETS